MKAEEGCKLPDFRHCFASRWRVNPVWFSRRPRAGIDPHCYYAAPPTVSACGRQLNPRTAAASTVAAGLQVPDH